MRQAQKQKRGGLHLVNLARPRKAFRNGRVEVALGRVDERWAKRWELSTSKIVFDGRSRRGISIVVSSLPFTAYRNNAKSTYNLGTGSAFISSSDIREVYAESGYPIAIKFSISMDPGPLPVDFPLMAEGGRPGEKLVDLARYSIPLKISTRDFAESICEIFALGAMAGTGVDGLRMGAERTERLELDASEWPRLLCACGNQMRLSGNDLSEGLVARIRPGEAISLELSRHAEEIREGVFSPSFGTIFIAEYQG